MNRFLRNLLLGGILAAGPSGAAMAQSDEAEAAPESRGGVSDSKAIPTSVYAGKIDFKQCEWVDEGLIPKAEIVPTKEMWRNIFKKADI